MSLADYQLCTLCAQKTFYDANLNYDFDEHPVFGLHNVGDMAVLCIDCAKAHVVRIIPKTDATPKGEGK